MAAPRPAIVAALAASLAISVPLIGEFEGVRLDPYRDIAGIPTVCYGETRVPMKRYTKQECDTMLKNAVGEFGERVLEVSPNLSDKPYALAAATSLAYNIGIQAYRNSLVARAFKVGNIKQACNNFLAWNKVRVNGQLVVSRGLDNRRKKERNVCLVNAI